MFIFNQCIPDPLRYFLRIWFCARTPRRRQVKIKAGYRFKGLCKNFMLQALFQSAEHLYEKREGSGSIPLTNGSGSGSRSPKTCRSCGSGSGSPTLPYTCNQCSGSVKFWYGSGIRITGIRIRIHLLFSLVAFKMQRTKKFFCFLLHTDGTCTSVSKITS